MWSIVAGVQEYIQVMIDRISGMKVLVLDAETVGIISMVFSQSDILSHEVFLVERLDADQHEKMRHLKAICFLRPTNQNFLALSKELKSPKYNEYHIFFTNVVPHMRLEQLACCDECEVVYQVQEFYADVFAVNHELFSLNLPSTSRLVEATSRGPEQLDECNSCSDHASTTGSITLDTMARHGSRKPSFSANPDSAGFARLWYSVWQEEELRAEKSDSSGGEFREEQPEGDATWTEGTTSDEAGSGSLLPFI
mmetsp:Transcript_14570/g.27582  ORF Transcript_14570/g.27582 Transcript_14570/m.27582 type:complete len:253 (-) Transcript_14570:134-892(-)